MLKNIATGAIRMVSPRLVSCARGYASSGLKMKIEPSHKPPKLPMEDISFETTVCPFFVARVVGLSPARWTSVFQKHPELKSITRTNLLSSVKALKDLNYSEEDIFLKPTILFVSATTIENRFCIMQECGIQPISLSRLFKYITIMNKSVLHLKIQQHLPYDLDVMDSLCAAMTDVDIEFKPPAKNEYNENMELKKIREIVLNAYLRQRLDMSDKDLVKLWKCYPRVRHKCFRSIESIIKLLIEDLKFSKERIVNNGFLLHGDAENVRRIIKEIPKIGSQDIHDIGYRRPKIIMSSCDAILKTLEHVKSFGINEDAVTRCLELLTLGPDTVLERLRDLNEVEEFRVLTSNPRVLRLVHYQNKARLRLEYLNQLKVRCASLHILSCGSEAFAKFARDGVDRTKGRDIVVYLSNLMKRNENDIRYLMGRHPNWCHIPSTHIKQVYDYLLSKKFSNDEIYQNIHLLLYPISRIDEKLTKLYGDGQFESMDLSNINIYSLSNNEILTLLLYLIECEFHFTGDGIWTEQHTQHMENFSNILPDFPEILNKVYKYGVKPTTNHKLNVQTNPA